MKTTVLICLMELLAVSATWAQRMAVEGSNSPYTIDGTTESWIAIWIADTPGYSGEMNIINGGTLNIGDVLDVGNNPGTGQTATLNVSDSTINFDSGADLHVGVHEGTFDMTVSGTSTVAVADELRLNYGDLLGTATLTINGGLVSAATTFAMDPGVSSTLSMNGGQLRVGNLEGITRPESKVFYNGGQLLVDQANVSEATMNSWISSGHIDVSGASSYGVGTTNIGGINYTALMESAPPPSGDPTIGLARVRFTDPHTARIMWDTSGDADAIVEYGTSPSLGERVYSQTSNTQHSVTLSGLQWRTKYYYRIGFSGTDGDVFSPTYWFDNAINFSVMDASSVPSPWPVDGQTEAYVDAASHILSSVGNSAGYVLVYGLGDGRLLFELAKHSDLTVVGVDTDSARVDAATEKLLEAGLYGPRIKVRHVADMASLPFSKDFFNLVVSGRAVSDGVLVGTAAEALRVVRPSGGHIFMGAPSGLPASAIHDWFAAGGVSVTPVDDGNGTWGDFVRGDLAEIGWWTHQYGTPANNGSSGESLGHVTSTADMQLQWLGRPGSDSGIDRNPRMPAPVSSNGRLFHQGYNRIMAMDSYNGTMLWSLEIPALRRVNIPRDTGNMCADGDGLFLAVKNECWRLDGDTGELLDRYRIEEPGQEWGAVFRYKDMLIGSVVPEGAHYSEFLGPDYWYDKVSGPLTYKVCSKSLFALDPATGDSLWGYTNGIIVETTICMGNDRVYFLESRNASVIATGGGRMDDSVWQDVHLVALDADTGTLLWDKPISPTPATVVAYMMYAPYNDSLVLLSSGTEYNMYTYSAADGAAGWSQLGLSWPLNNHGNHMIRPVVVNDKVLMNRELYSLADGSFLKGSGNHPSGCGTYAATTDALIYRMAYGRIGMQNVDTGTYDWWERLRSSCWVNFTPSGGLLLVPEGGGGCSCNGWINTSVGFSPKEQ